MSLAIITLTPLLIAFGFLYWSSLLDEGHEFLILLFQMLFLPLTFISINFAIIDVSILYGANAELIERLAQLVYYLGWVFFGIGVYWCFKIVGTLYNLAVQKKEAKKAEKYD